MRTQAAVALLIAGALMGIARAPSAVSGNVVIERMEAANPALITYRARVHVNVHMLNFPYLNPQLDGTSYFKRPARYEIVFDSVPFYMKNFSHLFADMGEPAAWERDDNVTLVGTRVESGRAMLVLRMTKKIHSDILAYTDAFVDARTYRLVRMEWHYTSGGTIAITRSYRDEHGFMLPAQEHASIDIPHVRAVGDAVYDAYQVNVVVDNTVFSR
ncbi:MAG: hypothetical protein ACREMP_10240 [Candidatus Tyrphobacter sp.]